MRVHIAEVSQPGSDRASTAIRTVVQESTSTTATYANSSLPSLALPQRPNQTDRHSHSYSRFEINSSTQLASSSTQSRVAFRQGTRAHSTTPAPHQGPITSYPALQMGGGVSSVDFTTSAFSFRVPNQTNYLAHRVSQNDHNPRPMPTGYSSGGRNLAGFTLPSTQPSAPMRTAPPRPSM